MAFKNITKYTPGFNINDVQKKFNIKKIIKLSSNENPFVSDEVTKYINNNKHSLNLYPESKPNKLQSIIAKNIGFKTVWMREYFKKEQVHARQISNRPGYVDFTVSTIKELLKVSGKIR